MKKEKAIEAEEKIKSESSVQKSNDVKKSAVTGEEKQSLIDLLSKQADDFAYISAKKKRESELAKVKFLLKGKEISLGEIRALVVAKALPYSPKFPNDVPFYKEIYRLMKWDDLDYKSYYKPRTVADLTNKIIYGRFPKNVLPSIQALNDYLPGCWVRGYKNFQFLNEEGQRQVLEYRDQAVKIMKECETMHEFRIKMHELYSVPYVYQQSLFDKKV